jgi:prevent-host-death family protein
MPYTIHQAKTHFSRLIKEAEAGKEVIVMRGKKPVARIVAAEPASPRRRLAGGFERLALPDSKMFDPMTDEDLVEYGFGFMLDAPLEKPKAREDTPPDESAE